MENTFWHAIAMRSNGCSGRALVLADESLGAGKAQVDRIDKKLVFNLSKVAAAVLVAGRLIQHHSLV
jgi:hypothetical protein